MLVAVIRQPTRGECFNIDNVVLNIARQPELRYSIDLLAVFEDSQQGCRRTDKSWKAPVMKV